jgi:hypothetical protein
MDGIQTLKTFLDCVIREIRTLFIPDCFCLTNLFRAANDKIWVSRVRLYPEQNTTEEIPLGEW